MPMVRTSLKNVAMALRDLGGQILALCLVIFLTDLAYGFFIASFPVYARLNGMSLVTLGLVSTLAGVIQLAASIPLGLLSDRIGRPGLICAGIVAIIFNMLILATFTATPLLVVGLILNSLSCVAVFQLGHAHLGDITTLAQRPLAFGLNTTAMALGFGLGPYFGGVITDRWGYPTAYQSGAAIGFAGLLLALVTLRRQVNNGQRRSASGLLVGVRLMLGRADLRLVVFGNLLMGLTFAASLATFLPLYGRELLLSQGAIGSMFAVRALVSAAGRVASSLLTRRVGNLSMMLVSILFITIAIFGVGTTTSPAFITLCLAIEGLAYGGFMVSGLTYVANHTSAENRGAAGGVYAMAMGCGATIAPWILGLVADRWGIRTVFFVTGTALIVGLVIFAKGVAALRADSREEAFAVDRSASDEQQLPAAEAL
jgi:MFS family permease